MIGVHRKSHSTFKITFISKLKKPFGLRKSSPQKTSSTVKKMITAEIDAPIEV